MTHLVLKDVLPSCNGRENAAYEIPEDNEFGSGVSQVMFPEKVPEMDSLKEFKTFSITKKVLFSARA